MATGGDRKAVCRFSATEQAEEQRVNPEPVAQQRDEDGNEDDDDSRPFPEVASPAERSRPERTMNPDFIEVHGQHPALYQPRPPSNAKAAEKMAEPTNSQQTMAEVLAVRYTD